MQKAKALHFFVLLFLMVSCFKKQDVAPAKHAPSPADVVMGIYNAYSKDNSNPAINMTGYVSIANLSDNSIKIYFITCCGFYYSSEFQASVNWDNSVDGKVNISIAPQCDKQNCIKGDGYFVDGSIVLNYSVSGNGDTVGTSFPFSQLLIGSK
jgi:hypothetical protein